MKQVGKWLPIVRHQWDIRIIKVLYYDGIIKDQIPG